MKRNYCCNEMEAAVYYHTVREEPFIDHKPQHNVFILEYVTNKRIRKRWLLFKEERINTKEIILKNCLWCSAVL